MYNGPAPPDAPGHLICFESSDTAPPAGVTLLPDTLRLPMLRQGHDIMLDNHGFPNHQRDYDFIIEECGTVDLICKTGSKLLDSINPIFDVKFDEALHSDYLMNI